MTPLSAEEIERAIAEHKAPITLPAALQEQQKQLVTLREGFKSYWDSKKTADPNMLAVDLDEFNRRNDELETADENYRKAVTPFIKAAKNEKLLGLQRAMGAAKDEWSFGSGGEAGEGSKSLTGALIEDEGFKSFRNNAGQSGQRVFNLKNIDMKALLSTTAGYAPPATRGDLIVEAPRRRPTIADYIPQVVTTEQFIVWMLQTVYTNNAAAVAEGGLKPESAVRWDEIKDQLEKIAHWIPLTTEVLKYNPRLMQLLDNEMIGMLRLKMEELMVTGTGVSPQLKGFFTRPGIAIYARQNGENNADALYQSMAQVRNDAYAEPGVVFINPNSFTPIALLKNTQGSYIYGNPSQGGPQTIWGKPVEQTKAIPAANALTGDFEMYSELYLSGDMNVEIGYVNDDFIKNRRVALAEMFALLLIKRASAFSNTQNLTVGSGSVVTP